jgi:hypothetical protein
LHERSFIYGSAAVRAMPEDWKDVFHLLSVAVAKAAEDV